MHALDEMQFLKFFERAVDRYQAQRAVFLARKIVHFEGGERMCGATISTTARRAAVMRYPFSCSWASHVSADIDALFGNENHYQ